MEPPYRELNDARLALVLAAQHRRAGRFRIGLAAAAVGQALADEAQLDDLKAQALLELGRGAYEIGSLREARAALEAAYLAPALKPSLRRACACELGWCLVRSGELGKGSEVLRTDAYSSEDPEVAARSLLGMAVAAEQEERLEDAVELFQNSERQLALNQGETERAELCFVRALHRSSIQDVAGAIDLSEKSYQEYSRLGMGRATIALFLNVTLRLKQGDVGGAAGGIRSLCRDVRREGRTGYFWIASLLAMLYAARAQKRSIWDRSGARIGESYNNSGYASVGTAMLLEHVARAGEGLQWPVLDLWSLARDQWKRLRSPRRAKLALKALKASTGRSVSRPR